MVLSISSSTRRHFTIALQQATPRRPRTAGCGPAASRTNPALYADTADRMGHAIVSGVRNRTTRISMAYLEAAARGEASEAWHRLVDAVAENDPDRIAAAARGVMAFGETSGSDMLAGFVMAAEALP